VEHEREMHELLVSSANEIGLTIEESHVDRFMCYLAHLIEWNKTTNLTAIVDPSEIVIKHFIDSLAALAVTKFPEQVSLVDVGSGGGFPGIPLKIVRPDMQLVLVEPVRKKYSFLNSTIGLLKLHGISAFNGTIEQYVKQSVRPVADMIVVRALKFDEIVNHASALIRPGGKIVLYRTEPIKDYEIGKHFRLVSEVNFTLPRESGKRIISVLEIMNP
jgi:16S rRNA (guanine527-N7)-methyltransferase